MFIYTVLIIPYYTTSDPFPLSQDRLKIILSIVGSYFTFAPCTLFVTMTVFILCNSFWKVKRYNYSFPSLPSLAVILISQQDICSLEEANIPSKNFFSNPNVIIPQYNNRHYNHSQSEKSTGRRPISSSLNVGDNVFLHHDRDKPRSRDWY